jgi:hypothetical protein
MLELFHRKELGVYYMTDDYDFTTSRTNVFKDSNGKFHVQSGCGELVIVLSPSNSPSEIYSGSIKIETETFEDFCNETMPISLLDDWIECLEELKEKALEKLEKFQKGNSNIIYLDNFLLAKALKDK